MAEGPPADATPPDPSTQVDQPADGSSTDAATGPKRFWERLVTTCRRLAEWLGTTCRRLWAQLASASQRLTARLVPAAQHLWGWMLSVARKVDAAAKEGPPPPPPEEPIERRESAGPFTVPARGYVFAFSVRATFTWSAQGLRPEQLAWYAHYFMPQATQRLTRIAGDLARTVPPHRAGELEERLQRALGRQEPWSFERGGRTVTCRPEAWIRLDERVRRALQPYWERLITLDCEYEEQTRRAQYAERINRRWTAILDDLAGADVPDDLREKVARAREHTMAEQRAAAQWTGDLLRRRRRQENLFEPFTEIDLTPKPRSAPPTGAAEQPARPGNTEPSSGPG
ncbi:hypothetical protein AB0873_24350 [Micromonospora sp. NPDC047707]|uniref:hypothetical protein n=1 Tax=Micromonospora sp. NPDC047707 TaxID=3154498 RepID=UPI0034527000